VGTFRIPSCQPGVCTKPSRPRTQQRGAISNSRPYEVCRCRISWLIRDSCLPQIAFSCHSLRAGRQVFQKAVPLRPGLYRLDVVVKDVESGNVGVIGTALRVPRFEDETLGASTLVIADQIESVPAKQLGLGPFVFGSYKVRPRLSREFTATESLGIFLQVYNLQSDDAVHRSSVYVTYRLLKEQREIWTTIESSDSIHQTGEQITVNRLIPLSAFAPGHYTLEVVVRDRVSGQSITRNAEFTLKP
jgi:hypothetical protein